MQPGIAGLHLLRHQVPAIAATAEQRLRGLADASAAWVVIANGYDRDAVAALGAGDLGEPSLVAMGAARGSAVGLFELAYAAVGSDVADIALPALAGGTA